MSRACDSKPGRGVPAEPIRQHITALLEAGATYKSIARAACVDERTVRNVHAGKRPSVYRGTAECLMDVDELDALDPERVVDAGPTRRRIAQLVAKDWRLVDIADHAGLSAHTLLGRNLTRGVTLRTEQRVEHVWRTYMGVTGNNPRPYPELAALIEGYTRSEVSTGAGVSNSTVSRIRAGLPLAPETARRVKDWLVAQRARQRAQQRASRTYDQAA